MCCVYIMNSSLATDLGIELKSRYHTLLFTLINAYCKNLVLDAGCGYGRWTMGLESVTSVVGIDISIKSCYLYKQNTSSYIINADVKHLPIKRNVFDSIIASSSIKP